MNWRYKVFACSLAVLMCISFGRCRTVAAQDHLCGAYGSSIEWVYRCNRQADNTVALTFDDGPHPKLTPIILDILKEYGIHATFFIVGENAERYPEIVNRIRNEGHEIGNHTYSHIKATMATSECIKDEILHCESVIRTLTDIRPKIFRPPCGAYDPKLGELCDSLGYRVVLWSVDTLDWCHTPSETISEHILKNIKAGDIILMHDYIGSNSPTPEALKKVIPALIARGYDFALVSELLDIGEKNAFP